MNRKPLRIRRLIKFFPLFPISHMDEILNMNAFYIQETPCHESILANGNCNDTSQFGHTMIEGFCKMFLASGDLYLSGHI